MRKKYKHYIITLLLITLIASTYYFYDNWNKTSNASTKTLEHTVWTWNITTSIKVVWKAELVDEQTLRFNQIWKVAKVNFKDWDNIKKNDIIAELDKTDINNDIKQAEISLQSSKLTLQQLLAWNNASVISKSKADIESTKQKISVAQKNLELAKSQEQTSNDELMKDILLARTDVKNSENSLALAKKELDNLKTYESNNLTTSETSYNGEIEKARLSVQKELISYDGILKDLNDILWIDKWTEYLNDSFETYLGNLSPGSLNKANSSYRAAKELRNNFNSSQDILLLIGSAIKLGNEILIASSDTYTLLWNTTTWTNYTEANLDSQKSSVAGSRSSAQQSINTLSQLQTNTKNLQSTSITKLKSDETIANKEESVKQSEIALIKAKEALNSLESTLSIKKGNNGISVVQAQNDINNLKSTLVSQTQSLAELQRGETKQRIEIAKNDIAQKELALIKVKKNTEKYEIPAPFDGVVRKIDFKVGDNLVADESKYIYIENPNLLRVLIILDQIDIVKITVGQEAKIIFDALPDNEFIGNISDIDKTPIEQSWVVSYKISLTLEKWNHNIFSGMTATVNIILSQRNNVLVVPNSFISENDNKSFVRKSWSKIEIKTWISDGKNSEILEGLSLWDIIEWAKIDFSVQTTDKPSFGGLPWFSWWQRRND